jgi:hypothetical protein
MVSIEENVRYYANQKENQHGPKGKGYGCRCRGICPGEGVPIFGRIYNDFGIDPVIAKQILCFDNSSLDNYRKKCKETKKKVQEVILELAEKPEYLHSENCTHNGECPAFGVQNVSKIVEDVFFKYGLNTTSLGVRHTLEKAGYKFPEPKWKRDLEAQRENKK